jgi:hypothetical protein
MSDREPEIIDQEAYASHHEVKGPHWPDECDHDPAEYVGTVAPIIRKRVKNPGRPASFVLETEILDVYVFDDNRFGSNVCLRFGPEGPDYYSPGGIVGLVSGAMRGMDAYAAALKMLEHKGHFRWYAKPQPAPIGYPTLYELDENREATGDIRQFCSQLCAREFVPTFQWCGWGREPNPSFSGRLCGRCGKPLQEFPK